MYFKFLEVPSENDKTHSQRLILFQSIAAQEEDMQKGVML